MMGLKANMDWERLWAPYDEDTYQAALAHVRSEDIVLDIGAGDLRLTRRIARRAAQVYAMEQNRSLMAAPPELPANLTILIGDAYRLPFPEGLTLTVLLMRHCRRFGLFMEKLIAVGCRRLVTNARWGFGVELIDLRAPRRTFAAVQMGWYGCYCGAVGFVPGPPERLTSSMEKILTEVSQCPSCCTWSTSAASRC